MHLSLLVPTSPVTGGLSGILRSDIAARQCCACQVLAKSQATTKRGGLNAV